MISIPFVDASNCLKTEDLDYCGDNEDSFLMIPPDFEQQPQTGLNLRLLPESKEKYLATYKKFMAWKEDKNEPISESTLLVYFTELSTKLGPTSLWSVYSMLKSVIKVNDNIDIGTYKDLTSFIKRQSDGYQPKKASVFTDEQIQKFLTVAANREFLVAKVVLIFGIHGSLKIDEMTHILVDHISEHGGIYLVHIPARKNRKSKSFIIQGEHFNIVQQYFLLRPKNPSTNRFFLNYQKGRCTVQPIGRNKFALIPRMIAEYLNLPDPNLYTGHSFRRTSAVLGNTQLRDNEGLKSSAILPESHEGNSLNIDIKKEAGDSITPTVHFQINSVRQSSETQAYYNENTIEDESDPSETEANSTENTINGEKIRSQTQVFYINENTTNEEKQHYQEIYQTGNNKFYFNNCNITFTVNQANISDQVILSPLSQLDSI